MIATAELKEGDFAVWEGSLVLIELIEGKTAFVSFDDGGEEEVSLDSLDATSDSFES